MAVKKMDARIRVRGGTYNQWYNANPVLLEREISFVMSGQNAGKFKVGDGATQWRALPFTAARFPEDVLQLADQAASSALPNSGDVTQLFQQARNYLKWETAARSAADAALQQADAQLQQDIAVESQARADGDFVTLNTAKAYTDAAILTTHTWLPSVTLKSDLGLIAGLSSSLNYLCRVIADPVQANNGVYQAVAGWSGSPVWTFFSDNQDWIDELELAAAIGAHNASGTAHQDIRAAIAAETQQRTAADQQLQNAIAAETQQRTAADQQLQNQMEAIAPGGNLPALVATLTDAAGSNVLPTTAANTLITAILQTVRNCLKWLVDAVNGKAPTSHASSTNTYGLASNLNYGHVRRAAPIGADDVSGATYLPFYHYYNATAVNPHNYYAGPHCGIYVFYNPGSGSSNLPAGWGTGSSNSAILEVLPFASDGIVQILYKRNSALTYKRHNYIVDSLSFSPWQKIAGHEVGDLYIQWPNEKTPMELGYDGIWTKWHDRVERYGLSTSRPSGYSTLFYEDRYDSINGNNGATVAAVAAGDYRQIVYKDGDREVMKALVAIAANAPFNPIEWEPLEKNTTASYRPVYKWRREVQPGVWGSASSSDLAIGASVTVGGTAYYVTARHNWGGKFLSMGGGNRPTYDSGGIGRDGIRNFPGGVVISDNNYNPLVNLGVSGPFSIAPNIARTTWASSGNASRPSGFNFDPSLAVPTGPENAGRTMPGQPWRKTS